MCISICEIFTLIKGNAYYIYPNIRFGILLHTGEWKSYSPMADSLGCLHILPKHAEHLANVLKHEMGVVVRENLLGKHSFPYNQQQGLLSVVQLK